MDHERLARLARERDLRGERALLVRARRAVAVEVEAGLADRDAALVRGQRAQLGQVGVVEARRVVRVAADRRVHLREGLGRGQRRAAGGAVDADGQHPRDARRDRRRDQLGVGRLAQVQVGVGVDHGCSDARLRSSSEAGVIDAVLLGEQRLDLADALDLPGAERGGGQREVGRAERVEQPFACSSGR